MSEENQVIEDELTVLKVRADQMGIKYHPAIGLDKLKEKIAEALNPAPTTGDEEGGSEETGAEAPAESEAQKRYRLKKEASKLVRIRLTCMNPKKSEWDGEVFTVGNSVAGEFRRFVPFNVEWHVEQIMLNMIQQRQCQIFQTVRDGRGGSVRKGKLIKEFSVEVLPPLTEKELKELAQRQAMARGQTE